MRLFNLASVLFFLLTPHTVFPQTQATYTPINRYQGLAKCALPNIDAGTSASITQKLFYESPFARHFAGQRLNYEKLDFRQKHQVLESMGAYRLRFGRLEKPFTRYDEEKMAFEMLQQKLKLAEGVLSVGAGGNLGGASFAENKRVFVYRDLQGKQCWTYGEKAEGSEQVFDYDGFEEIAAANADPAPSCSAVIIGQSYALTARHCLANGVLYIPTKASRQYGASTARRSIGCSWDNQYTMDCEYEVVKYQDVSSFSAVSTQTVELKFKSPVDNQEWSFDVLGGTEKGSPDIRLIRFERRSSSTQRQPILVTSKIAIYNENTIKKDGMFSFVRAGYGKSFEQTTPSLTIGSWLSEKPPVQVSRPEQPSIQSLYEYAAMFHSANQTSRICKGDSGGALFSGTPNGKEPPYGSGSRTLVGIVSAAKEHGNATSCLQSPVEISHVIGDFYFKRLCDVSKNEINGCKK
jgi:Trypsin